MMCQNPRDVSLNYEGKFHVFLGFQRFNVSGKRLWSGDFQGMGNREGQPGVQINAVCLVVLVCLVGLVGVDPSTLSAWKVDLQPFSAAPG